MHMSTSIGAALQSCALGNKLADMGHSPYLLYYAPPHYFDISVRDSHVSSIRSAVSYILNGRYKEDARLRFMDFKSKNHPPITRKYMSLNELSEDSPNFDAYICGSDQVWNPIITHFDKSYFFPFVTNNAPKISYAASIGKDLMTPEIDSYLKDGLPHLDRIGVREDTAVSEIKRLLPGAEVTQNIDPTFLLSREAWRKMSVKPNGKLPEKYVLYYPINETPQGAEIVNEIKNKYSLPCVSFSNSIRKCKGIDINLHSIGPAEFLYLCDHAEYVATNSFHGFSLAIIMRKKVICFTKQGQNTRMESLSRLLNLQKLIVSDIADVRARNWDEIWNNCYIDISDAIVREQSRADMFLREALKST